MSRHYKVQHEFVTSLPDELEEGKVYVSTKFKTAAHKCMCGCGLEVVTPIRPTDWHLIFDGETISLKPSIGNWGFPCESHYFITRNRVDWAGHMSKEAIQRGRDHDAAAKSIYFKPVSPPPARPPVTQSVEEKAEGGMFGFFIRAVEAIKSWHF